MAKLVDSGLHKLNELFSERAHEFAQESRRLRTELDRFERERKNAQAKEQPGYTLIVFEIMVAVIALVGLAGIYGNYEDPPLSLGIVVLLIIPALMVIVTITYAALVSSPRNTREELSKHCAELRSRLHRKSAEYHSAIIERLQDIAEKEAEIGRVARRGNGSWLFFCASYTAVVDFAADQILIVNSIDCREIQLAYKELERRSVSVGTISSRTKPSIAGAAIGGVVFGGSGMVAGSVIGSAGQRKMSTETIERKVGKHVVDLYTRLQEFPIVTLEFDNNETLAKEYYAVVSAAIPRTN